jgi:two-component system chemotaxis sensor kinase CheA
VSGKDAGERASLLLVRAGDGRMAVPLELVDRLEELDSARVERAGDRELVQYRGRILPLLRPTRHLPERRGAARGRAVAGPGPLRVVVCSVDGQRWGLVVDGIEDIARETAAVRGAATRDGVAGVLVVQERVTELLDLRRLARLAGLCPGAAEAEAA